MRDRPCWLSLQELRANREGICREVRRLRGHASLHDGEMCDDDVLRVPSFDAAVCGDVCGAARNECSWYRSRQVGSRSCRSIAAVADNSLHRQPRHSGAEMDRDTVRRRPKRYRTARRRTHRGDNRCGCLLHSRHHREGGSSCHSDRSGKTQAHTCAGRTACRRRPDESRCRSDHSRRGILRRSSPDRQDSNHRLRRRSERRCVRTPGGRYRRRATGSRRHSVRNRPRSRHSISLREGSTPPSDRLRSGPFRSGSRARRLGGGTVPRRRPRAARPPPAHVHGGFAWPRCDE